MPDPINYSLPAVNPLQSFAGGYDMVNGIRANQISQQQAQLDLAKKQRLQADLQKISENPTPAAIAALSVQHPELSEQFKRSFDMLNTDQRDQKTAQFVPIYAAVLNGDTATAVSKLRQIAEAQKNSGMDKDAEGTTVIADSIEKHPESAKTLGGLTLANLMGPEKFESTFSGLQKDIREQELQPTAVSKAKSDAEKAAITAKYADQTERMNLAKQSEDIRASKENTRLRAIEVALNKEGNGLKRAELQQKFDFAKRDYDQKVAERLADADAGFATIQDSKDIVNGLLGDVDTLKEAIGAGGWRAWIPGSDARGVNAKLERLGNTLAAANLDKLKGAMSDKDIVFLKNISTNLDRFQGEGDFIKELKRVGEVLDRNEKILSKRYGSPAPINPNSATSNSPAISNEAGSTVSNW